LGGFAATGLKLLEASDLEERLRTLESVVQRGQGAADDVDDDADL
jgi:hypothetical protein